jgi:hypothetical protein
MLTDKGIGETPRRTAFDIEAIEMIEELLMLSQRVAKLHCAIATNPPADLERVRDYLGDARLALDDLKSAIEDAARAVGLDG